MTTTASTPVCLRLAASLLALAGVPALSLAQAPATSGGAPGAGGAPAASDAPDAGEEAKRIRNLVRLTSPDQFLKAGEAYFDPYTRWVIFQAVPKPAAGKEPSAHYSMFVAKLRKDAAGRITGIEQPIRLTPEGSADTCGFFNPVTPYKVIFGATIIPPAPPTDPSAPGVKSSSGPGYKRESGSYVWEFPPETEVCSRSVDQIYDDILPTARDQSAVDADADRPIPVFVHPGYDAECSFSPDGRYILYTRVELGQNNPDIYIYELATGEHIPIIRAPGYDGGPFFSPDGKHICYRSDRKGDSLLQLMVADLAFDQPPAAPGAPDDGKEDAGPPPPPALRGLKAEHAVTANQHVNWAPFWSPDGAFLIYTTSEIGHDNYELFTVEAPVGANASKAPDALKKRRITSSVGFDGLPAFSKDGRLLMWTSQRPADAEGHALNPSDPRAGQKETSQVWVAEVVDIRP